MYIVSSVQLKGGVGKTSIAKGLAESACAHGKKVLLLDLCGNSDVATKFGYDRSAFGFDTFDWISGNCEFEQAVQNIDGTTIDFIPASEQVSKIEEWAAKNRYIGMEFILRDKLAEVPIDYDLVFIDNHPQEDKKFIMSLVASQLALIPLMLEKSAIIGAVRTIEIIRQLQKQGLVIEYKILPVGIDFSKGFGKELAALENEFTQNELGEFLPAIRYSSVVARATLKGADLNLLKSKYAENIISDYNNVASVLGGVFI